MASLAIQICLMISPQLTVLAAPSEQDSQLNGYGPEVRSFLELMRHEADELEFQIKHNEISRRDYIRSKARISIHRQAVLNLIKETREDYVPEVHVVVASELEQLIEDGTTALR